eukprot:1141380-Pelagomonas_calceolata.AAC.9
MDKKLLGAEKKRKERMHACAPLFHSQQIDKQLLGVGALGKQLSANEHQRMERSAASDSVCLNVLQVGYSAGLGFS